MLKFFLALEKFLLFIYKIIFGTLGEIVSIVFVILIIAIPFLHAAEPMMPVVMMLSMGP